jgi:hypothetical protein
MVKLGKEFCIPQSNKIQFDGAGITLKGVTRKSDFFVRARWVGQAQVHLHLSLGHFR